MSAYVVTKQWTESFPDHSAIGQNSLIGKWYMVPHKFFSGSSALGGNSLVGRVPSLYLLCATVSRLIVAGTF